MSRDLPIAIVRESSHLGVLNSRALELAGIDASTANPEGRVIYERPAKVAGLPPPLGMHGDPSLPVPKGIKAVAQGDGDLGPALNVIYDRLAPVQP